MGEHKRIWLEPEPGSDPDGGRMWAENDVWGDGTEYVLASEIAAALAVAEERGRVEERERCKTHAERVEAEELAEINGALKTINETCLALQYDYRGLYGAETIGPLQDVAKLVNKFVFRLERLQDRAETAEARIAELEALVKEEGERGDHWFDLATYDVGGAPRLWKDRAEAAEARSAALELRLAEAERVIDPLAKVASDIPNHWLDSAQVVTMCGYFRAARAWKEGK